MLADDVSAVFQEQYFPDFLEQWVSYFGKVTNRIFKPTDLDVVSDGINFQYELGPSDTARSSTSILGSFASPQQFNPGSFKIRFSQTGACDFVRVSASAQVTDLDMVNGAKGRAVDIVQRVVKQIIPGYDEHLAMLRNLPKSGQICSIATTPGVKKNDARTLGAASSSPTNAAGLRFGISGASRAFFRPNKRIDFVVGGVVVAGNILVTDVNLADPHSAGYGSVGCSFVSSGVAGQASTGDLSLVTSAATVYHSGEYNAGMYSMGAFFTSPTAGESFIGGIDRTTSNYRFMVPVTTREYDSAGNAITANATINQSHFTDLANSMNYTDEEGVGGLFVGSPETCRKLQNDIFQASIINVPTDSTKAARFGHFGMSGVLFQDPTFGTTQIVADPLINPNRIRFIVPKTWMQLNWGWKGLRSLPGDKGAWYRLNDPTPNIGRSIVYKSDWYALHCDMCSQPWRNGEIRAITA